MILTTFCPHSDPGPRTCAGCPSLEDGERWCEGEVSGRAVAGWAGGIAIETDGQTCACVLTDAEQDQVSDQLAERACASEPW